MGEKLKLVIFHWKGPVVLVFCFQRKKRKFVHTSMVISLLGRCTVSGTEGGLLEEVCPYYPSPEGERGREIAGE